MIKIVIKSIKSGFNILGFDIVKQENSPKMTWLGLKSRNIQTVIDIGANTGQFAKKITYLFPRSKIYCFEPLPDAFEELTSWAATQQGRVIPLNLALGKTAGEVEMFLHEEHPASSSLLATTKLTEQYYPTTKNQKRIVVRQSNLDDALDGINADLTSEVLIKMDVQGFEANVIAGGHRTFNKATACILEVGLDDLYEGQASFLELLTTLNGQGYRYMGNLAQIYGADGHCIYLDAVFIRFSK
jgi:FkbM family methyltransferase